MAQQMWNYDTILEELNKSDRWGINDQPVDPAPIARVLANLPVSSVNMKEKDTLLLSFTRPLSEEEANRVRQAVNLDPVHDDDPFDTREALTEAFCWWD